MFSHLQPYKPYVYMAMYKRDVYKRQPLTLSTLTNIMFLKFCILDKIRIINTNILYFIHYRIKQKKMSMLKNETPIYRLICIQWDYCRKVPRENQLLSTTVPLWHQPHIFTETAKRYCEHRANISRNFGTSKRRCREQSW